MGWQKRVWYIYDYCNCPTGGANNQTSTKLLSESLQEQLLSWNASPPHIESESWQRALASHSVMGSSDKQALMADGGGQIRMSSINILKPQAKEISSCFHNAPTECMRCKWENVPQRQKNDKKWRFWIPGRLTTLCMSCCGSESCVVCLPGYDVITLGSVNEGNKAQVVTEYRQGTQRDCYFHTWPRLNLNSSLSTKITHAHTT